MCVANVMVGKLSKVVSHEPEQGTTGDESFGRKSSSDPFFNHCPSPGFWTRVARD